MAPLSSRFEEALLFAARLHAEQARKGSGVPYVSHLLAVCSLVLEFGGDEEQAIAGLLHDAIEDQGGDAARQQIRERFGERVAALVDGCSDTDIIPKPPWRQRKEAYLEHLRHAPADVRLVSGADKLHNLRTLLTDYRQQGEKVWERFRGGKEGSLWYARETTSIFLTAGPLTVGQEMQEALADLEALVAQQG